MKMNKICLFAVALTLGICSVEAAPVKVTMNTTSPTMSLCLKGESTPISIADPTKMIYDFDAAPGTYTLTAYGTDGTTVNGTIDLVVNDGKNEVSVLTCTAYVTNRNADNSAWSVANGDITLDVKVNSREGLNRNVQYGNSTTVGRNTFLAFKGDSYQAFFYPSEKHEAEGFGYLFKTGTLTSGSTVSGAVPMAVEFTVSAPSDAIMQLGIKTVHFVDFLQQKPVKTVANGDITEYTYRLNVSQKYNYRTMRKGGLTLAGLFSINSDASKNPVINFTETDYTSHSPKEINHSTAANNGYETGDIFVNINEKGYKRMVVGEKFDAHAMRTWQITNNTIDNYFIEPDFHYTILDLEGKPSQDVLKIETEPGSAWATVTAQKQGTAIVLVTYDAIQTNNWYLSEKQGFEGGDFWGAIWPENTAVYVISVGEAESSVTPEFHINKDWNDPMFKKSGDNVDAELDVFYYLDSEPGCNYTFTADGANSVTVAYPTIGENMATYSGFTADGITKNENGTYIVLLKLGRQIIRLTDHNGNSTYQVLTAKPCKREITNITNPGAEIFLPGETIKIQYSGLRHPANKLAGIHNFSAAICHNDEIWEPGQYAFGNDPEGQSIELEIPSKATTTFDISEGSFYLSFFGDPLGNHRLIGRTSGRSANFTAVMQNSYMGYLPGATINLGGNSTGISDTISEGIVATDYYNLRGERSELPWNGMNIVRYSDGSTRKVVIKTSH